MAGGGGGNLAALRFIGDLFYQPLGTAGSGRYETGR
jgi:hypothetical protein